MWSRFQIVQSQVDFAESTETETETRKRKHGKYCACSKVHLCKADVASDTALAHVFFESVFAPDLSGTQPYSVASSVCSFIYPMSGDQEHYHFFKSSEEDLK